jgi:predicted nucleic acid-binding protein
MVKALFDTNILIDYLNAVPQARHELTRYQEKAISIITWMEVLIGAKPEVEIGTRAFLAGFTVISVDNEIAERAVALRKTHRIKLPDAIIWATADAHSMLLITRNIKDFPKGMPDIRIPYEI